MAYYAFIDSDNFVVEVISGKDENDTENLPSEFSSWEEYYQSQRTGLTCKRTSYNTKGNQHIEGGTAFRGNFAEIGGKYDSENDVFLQNAEGYNGWVLDENYLLQPPTAKPDDDLENGIRYMWDNDNEVWQEWTWNSNLEIWELPS